MKHPAPNAERIQFRRDTLDRQIAHVEEILRTGQRPHWVTGALVHLTAAQIQSYRVYLAELEAKREAL